MAHKPTYEEAMARLSELEGIFEALKHQEVDAIVGSKNVLLLRIKEVEENLKKQRQDMEELLVERGVLLEDLKIHQTERDAFLDALAHELKTPLTSALSSSELLASELRNHPQNLRLLSEDAWTATRSLVRLVDDILDFGKDQQTRLKYSIQRVDLCPIVLAVRDEFDTRLRAKDQHLSLTLPDAPIWVIADPVRMKQALRNLMDNAAKFSPQGSSICLRITTLDSAVQMEVEDAAEPIDSQDHGHLFTPYYRGLKAQERRARGLGLGLFISKQLVELQGGKIWLETNGQRGNRFCISLPRE